MEKNQKGQRKIVNLLDTSAVDTNNSRFQQLVKRVNNCDATYWKCKACTVPKIKKCYAKARVELQTEAFQKYHEREEYRKGQESLGLPNIT